MNTPNQPNLKCSVFFVTNHTCGFMFICQGGYVNSHKLEISTGPDEEWTVRGLFASQPLGKGEMVSGEWVFIL